MPGRGPRALARADSERVTPRNVDPDAVGASPGRNVLAVTPPSSSRVVWSSSSGPLLRGHELLRILRNCRSCALPAFASLHVAIRSFGSQAGSQEDGRWRMRAVVRSTKVLVEGCSRTSTNGLGRHGMQEVREFDSPRLHQKAQVRRLRGSWREPDGGRGGHFGGHLFLTDARGRQRMPGTLRPSTARPPMSSGRRDGNESEPRTCFTPRDACVRGVSRAGTVRAPADSLCWHRCCTLPLRL